MKLSRNTLRSLAVGFLASAVVTAAFALSQGQLLIEIGRASCRERV